MCNSVIYPEFVNLTHIYSYHQLEDSLASALRMGCPLIISQSDQSAMGISLQWGNYVLVNKIITYLIEFPTTKNCYILNGHLTQLNEMLLPNLGRLYDASMIT